MNNGIIGMKGDYPGVFLFVTHAPHVGGKETVLPLASKLACQVAKFVGRMTE